MRFSIWIGTEQPWPDVVAAASHCAAEGWDGVYLADHFMPDGPSGPGRAGPRLEAWTAIAALSSLVPRVRLGVLVSGNTYRHPAVLAKMAATVDTLSDGRHVLGLGAGWQASEHEAYGIPLGAPSERLDRLDEACQVIKSLFSKERTDFEGRYYRLKDAPCEPKPLQQPLPLLIGVSGERRAIALAARHADEWNCWGLPDLIARKSAILDRACEELGRDPSSVRRSAQALVMMSDDPAELRRSKQSPPPMPSAIGSPSELVEVMAAYEAAGVGEFVVSDRPLGETASERRDQMSRFFEEVAAPLSS